MLAHRHVLERQAYGWLRNEHDASEVVQEALLRAYRCLDDFRGHAEFSTWLHRIVTNLCIDHLRRRKYQPTQFSESWLLGEENWPSAEHSSTDSDDPCLRLLQKEVLRKVLDSIEALPQYHQRSIRLRELDGLSYEEIAAEMGVSKGTVMSRLFHARRKLQRSLSCLYLETFGR